MTESNPTNPDQPGPSREDVWQPCPPGEISGMVTGLQNRRRAMVVGRTTFAAALVLLVAAASQFSGLNTPEGPDTSVAGEHDCGGIHCSEAMAHLKAYREGTLDEKTTAQVRAHVEECPLCGPRFREMNDGSAQVSAGVSTIAMAGTGLAR